MVHSGRPTEDPLKYDLFWRFHCLIVVGGRLYGRGQKFRVKLKPLMPHSVSFSGPYWQVHPKFSRSSVEHIFD